MWRLFCFIPSQKGWEPLSYTVFCPAVPYIHPENSNETSMYLALTDPELKLKNLGMSFCQRC